MSFILDALKKSESERQNRSGAGFSSVPTGTETPRRSYWLWIIGLLLAINLAVLLGILLRPAPDSTNQNSANQNSANPDRMQPAQDGSQAPEAAETAIPSPRPQAAPAEPLASTFEERVATARRDRAASTTPVAEDAGDSDPEATPASESVSIAGAVSTSTSGSTPVSTPVSSGSSAGRPAVRERIPTIDELRLEGSIDLPELRIDIHVYGEEPSQRFVFINMNKYREQSRLAEGPLVSEIRADGVVLEYRGRTFLLPRE